MVWANLKVSLDHWKEEGVRAENRKDFIGMAYQQYMRTTGGSQQFGDTTLTKVFVGGLAWETQRETMRRYFEQFGEILEAVVITDKNTGRSKGYGFVSVFKPFFFLWVLAYVEVFNFLSDLHGCNGFLFWGTDWPYGLVLLFSCAMGLGDLPRS